MKIQIVIDSASDITLQELKQWQVKLIPMPLFCGNDTWQDDKTKPMDVFWDLLIGGSDVKTSQPSPDAFAQVFEQAKKAGEAVICVLISSKLSGTYQGAVLARSMVGYENIYIVDAKGAAAAAAEKLLVKRACELRDAGELSAPQIAADLEQFRGRIRLFACLDTLGYIARGGRLPKSVAAIGNAIKLKPIVCFSAEGEIHVLKKVLGGKNAMREMTELAMSHSVCADYPVIPLFAQNDENCLCYVESLRNAGFPVRMQEPQGIGATIGTYIGPGGYGIAFVE